MLKFNRPEHPPKNDQEVLIRVSRMGYVDFFVCRYSAAEPSLFDGDIPIFPSYQDYDGHTHKHIDWWVATEDLSEESQKTAQGWKINE